MANHTRRKQIPVNSGGSYSPKEGVNPPQYVLAEKIREMLRYARPLVTAFPARDNDIRDALRGSMLTLLLLANKLDRMTRSDERKEVIAELTNEFADLKELIVLASDRDYYSEKYAPPLSLKRREVWGRYNKDIATMIEGLK